MQRSDCESETDLHLAARQGSGSYIRVNAVTPDRLFSSTLLLLANATTFPSKVPRTYAGFILSSAHGFGIKDSRQPSTIFLQPRIEGAPLEPWSRQLDRQSQSEELEN